MLPDVAEPAELELDRAIQRGMPQSWEAFFARFGRLTPIQRRSIPIIQAGSNALVCAGTASGKTEAVCAPLIERYAVPGSRSIILYISPTRALINDLYERLATPLGLLSLRIARRTGEYKDKLDSPPNVLLTTPESLDSMFCRLRPDPGRQHILSHVAAVVLDEVHLLYGTARGEQVRWLLERLRRLRHYGRQMGWHRSDRVQIVGLSATVADPNEIRDRFAPGGQIVMAPKHRDIVRVRYQPMQPVEHSLPRLLAVTEQPQKVLVFCNSKRRVDSLSQYLRRVLEPTGYDVRAHHGHLSKQLREEAETAVKTQHRIVVVATSTLEIGIDIGDIDLVALADPPLDVAALLQRIGRGNRRRNETRVMPCAADARAAVIQAALLDAAEDGWLGDERPGPQHAVARQQIASYIYQGPRRARPRPMLTAFMEALLPPAFVPAILDHLVHTGELVSDESGIRLSTELLDACAAGRLHSNIEDSGGSAVIDEKTGAQIAVGIDYRGGRGMNVGGLSLQVTRTSGSVIEVARGNGAAEGAWSYARKPFFVGAGQPESVRRMLGLEPYRWPALCEEHATYVFHFGGARRRSVLELLIRATGVGGLKVNPWYVRSDWSLERLQEWLRAARGPQLEFVIGTELERLERTLARPYTNRHLPMSVRLHDVREWLRLDTETALLHNVVAEPVTGRVAQLVRLFVQ